MSYNTKKLFTKAISNVTKEFGSLNNEGDVEIDLPKSKRTTTQRIKDDKMHNFDHVPFFGIVNGFMNIINIAFVGIEYCTWPGFTNKNTFITMGLADSESKKESLRKMGMDEDFIEWQSPGNVK